MISPEQRQELVAMESKDFTPMAGTGFVASAPETNSEVGAMMSEEGQCHICMWREVRKDVFVHGQIISVYGARALFTALGAALAEYDAKKTKAN